ncbi:MAG: leucine-rich repeat domain-containing protein, partial [Paludibacteraceae bacterium]|nr:leucine-rich repeat domain-containing protein [Paludibacteraceae bacterium]
AFNNCNERLRVLMEQKGFYNSSADFQKYIEVNGKTVTVKEGVRYIPEKAFEKALYEKVVLPNSLKGIRSFAFCGSKLKSLYLPESVVELDYMAFAECPNLKEVVLPNNITKMESRIFAECENLETVSFCENLSIVPSRCFDGCKNLKTVNLGSNVQRISVFAFHNCYRLSSVNIPTQCAVDTDAFVNCYSFFPDPSLPAYGFRNCDRPAAGWNVILEESITMVLEVTRSFFSKTLGWILLGLMVAVYVSLFFLKKHKFTPFIKATIIVIVSLLAFLVSSIFICQGKNPIAILFFTVFFSALGSFLCLRNCRMSLGILLALLCISELLYLFLLWLSPFFSYRG